jgi:hypothetical protein
MNSENLQKLLPIAITLILGIATIYLSFRQFLLGSTHSYREEYKFSKAFFDDLEINPRMHKYVRHKGYQAVLGNKSVESEVIEYLMRTKEPVNFLRYYGISRSYLKHEFIDGKLQLKFESRFRFSTPERRKLWLIFYAVISLFFYLAAFSPIFLWTFKTITSSVALGLGFFTFPLGLIGTFVFSLEFVRLALARKLLNKLLDEELQYIPDSHEEHY